MTLRVEKPGLQTTVQAAPFRGLRHLGMPAAGPADLLSHALANTVVGNASETAALEIVFGDASFVAESALTVALAGAPGPLFVDETPCDERKAISLMPGQRLSVGRITGGCRRYLAVAGGFAVAPTMGSQSTYLPAKVGGFAGRVLQAGDDLPVAETLSERPTTKDWPQMHLADQYLLRVFTGPEAAWLGNGGTALTESLFTVSRRADRMGLRLEGARLMVRAQPDMASSAVFPGTLQCPPDGAPFLLGPDAQTTGGYPRVAQVIRADRHLIGQLKSGDSIRFVLVDVERAHAIYREKLAQWRALIPDLRLD